MSEGLTWLAAAGAAVVVGAVVAHTGSLVAMARAATLSGRLRVVVWFYVAGGTICYRRPLTRQPSAGRGSGLPRL